jgi:DNA-directed RNA polymerase specialized sigma24 family protein
MTPLSLSEETHRSRWLRQLRAGGLRPELFVIEEHETEARCYEAEAELVEYFRSIGCDLTNTAPGGRGAGSGRANHFFGRAHSEETRRRISKHSMEQDMSHTYRAVVDQTGKVYKSLTQAASELGVSRSTVCNALHRGRPVRGVTVAYIEDGVPAAQPARPKWEKALAASKKSRMRPVTLSDGRRFESVVAAARDLLVTPTRVHDAARLGGRIGSTLVSYDTEK